MKNYYDKEGSDMIRYLSEPREVVIAVLSKRLKSQLDAGKKVLWLLSGGSGIDTCVSVAKSLHSHDVSRLFVTLSDERYGDIGHKDENWQQLLDAGFSIPDAHLYRPLKQGLSRHEATEQFKTWLDTTWNDVDYRIALLGIGDDGHTSGVKPNSPAVSAEGSVVDFTGTDFERITTTIHTLERLDEAIVQSYGESKHGAISRIVRRQGSIKDTPGLVVGRISSVTFFSDYQFSKEDI